MWLRDEKGTCLFQTQFFVFFTVDGRPKDGVEVYWTHLQLFRAWILVCIQDSQLKVISFDVIKLLFEGRAQIALAYARERLYIMFYETLQKEAIGEAEASFEFGKKRIPDHGHVVGVGGLAGSHQGR